MEGRTYTTHLHNWKIAVIEDMQAYKQGIFVQISNEGVCEALKQTTSLSVKLKELSYPKQAK